MKWLVMVFLFLTACGSHRSESTGFSTGGEVQRVEKPVEPADQLLEALRAGDTTKIKALLDEGFPINGPLKNGKTPLIEAVIWSKAEVVELLIARGADVGLKDPEGRTALDHASENPALLRLLQPRTDEERRALFLAVSENRYNDVKRMLTEGVDGNVEDDDGETPLTLAVRLNLEFVVRVLVQPGSSVDVNRRNRSGASPLGLAIELKRPRIEKMLRQRGAKED